MAWGAGTMHAVEIDRIKRVELVDGTWIKKVAYVEFLDSGVLKVATVVKKKQEPTYHEVSYLAAGQWKRVVPMVWTLVVDTEDGRSAEIPGMTRCELWSSIEKTLREDGNDDAEVERLIGLLAKNDAGPHSKSQFTFKVSRRL